MEERMFVDPDSGDMHPESYYHKENIDHATVIEAVLEGDHLGFIIIPEHVPRMRIRHQAVFELMKSFAFSIANRFVNSDDEEERESLHEVGIMLSVVMLKNVKEMEMERGDSNLH